MLALVRQKVLRYGPVAAGVVAAPLAIERQPRPGALELVVALVSFAGLCVAVLMKSRILLEPDDFAYRGSIAALAYGHLTLSQAQYHALAYRIGGIQQWVPLPHGRWVSEKNPGYTFLAAPFQLVGALRVAPLFYGAIGCFGLFVGGRKWLGRLGGAWAVAFFCGSGATIIFAWRATMPTFAEAALIAAGTGGLLWAMLADDASNRRRTVAGLLAFIALELATFSRYTNGLVLAVAFATVLLSFRRARLGLPSVVCWVASVVVFGAVVAAFNATVYGGVTETGYLPGEVTFALSAVVPNLEHVPRRLVTTMPLLLPALAGFGWIAARARRSEGRRDAAVGAALAASWLAIFALYIAYTWTVQQERFPAVTIHVVRFYMPAIGGAALLAAWLVQRLPRPASILSVAAAMALGLVSYHHLAHRTGIDLQPGAPEIVPSRFPAVGPPAGIAPPSGFRDT